MNMGMLVDFYSLHFMLGNSFNAWEPTKTKVRSQNTISRLWIQIP